MRIGYKREMPRTNYTAEETGKGRLREVKMDTEDAKNVMYVMMGWYGSTMPGLVVVRKG